MGFAQEGLVVADGARVLQAACALAGKSALVSSPTTCQETPLWLLGRRNIHDFECLVDTGWLTEKDDKDAREGKERYSFWARPPSVNQEEEGQAPAHE
eukprot:COSAG01_NODE_10783_length_2081_cov_1.765893_2_plen_97_part_01